MKTLTRIIIYLFTVFCLCCCSNTIDKENPPEPENTLALEVDNAKTENKEDSENLLRNHLSQWRDILDDDREL